MEDNPMLCPQCKEPIKTDYFYCPTCGKILKIKPIEVSFPKQLLVYFVSFFFAPFGLAWAIPYIRNPNRKTKMVGIVVIILTLVALGITVATFNKIMGDYSKVLNSIGSGKYPY